MIGNSQGTRQFVHRMANIPVVSDNSACQYSSPSCVVTAVVWSCPMVLVNAL